MLKHRNLEELYRKTERTIVTAHRGFSGRYPENTLTAMREAVRAGADIIEFDLRPTADGIPVLLHDPTLDRTSNAHGCPEDYTLKELKKFNFSYFRGGHETGKRMEEPEYPEMPIPTFEEVLSELKNEVFMNIQLTRPSDPFLKTICDLFKQYDMYETAYFVTQQENQDGCGGTGTAEEIRNQNHSTGRGGHHAGILPESGRTRAPCEYVLFQYGRRQPSLHFLGTPRHHDRLHGHPVRKHQCNESRKVRNYAP